MLQLVHKMKNLIVETRKKSEIRELSSFLYRISTLLEEGYTFSDSIMMLLPYHVKNMDDWKYQLYQKFSSGATVIEILSHFAIPKHYLVMLQIAEEKGDLAKTLKHVAKQMKFHEKLKNKFIKLVSYPLFLMIVLIGIFVVFRKYFFPNIQLIVDSNQTTGSTSFHLAKYLLHLPDFLLVLTFMTVCCIVFFLIYMKTQQVDKQLRILLKLPFIQYFYRLNITKQFAHLLGSLLVAGFSLQHALEILKEQEISKQLSYITALVEGRVIYGESLSEVVRILEIFTPKFEVFIRHGEETGHLGREMMIYSDLLEERIQNMIQTTVSIIQPLFFMMIAICIVAAYVSILLPMYELFEIF